MSSEQQPPNPQNPDPRPGGDPVDSPRPAQPYSQPGGYPQPGQTYPQPGQQPYPQPGQGYPQPGQGYPQTGQGYPQSGQAYPQPGPQQYPQPGAYGGQYGPPAPGYGQPGNPQRPYGQAQPPAQQPDNPYQITHYAAQYASQGYSQPQPAARPYQPSPIAAKKSPVLGMVGFGIVVVALLAVILAALPIGEVLANLIVSSGSTQIDQTLLAEILAEQVPVPAMLLNVGATVGFAGWVVGIVAAATGRGRMWGVLAIVVGTLAPFLMLAAMMIPMFPALSAVR